METFEEYNKKCTINLEKTRNELYREITIIDLLNKIANGEEVPKKIKFHDVEWEYKGYQYKRIDNVYLGNIWNGYNFNILNDKVEILEEEKKIPEKIDLYEDGEGHYFIDKHCKKIYITCDEINFMVEEFNQLIDYLKSKGDE